MMQQALAAITFLAAVGATYVFCVRPMRQGRYCAKNAPTDTTVPPSQPTTANPREDLQAARAELTALRTAITNAEHNGRPEGGASDAHPASPTTNHSGRRDRMRCSPSSGGTDRACTGPESLVAEVETVSVRCEVTKKSQGAADNEAVPQDGGMKVELLYFVGCPNWLETDARLREALTVVGSRELR